MAEPRSLLNYVLIGAEMSLPVSIFALCIAPIVLYLCPFREFFVWHCWMQLALFIPVVQIPAFLFNRMSYVDIGWPCGLVMLAVTTLTYGTGYWVRRVLTCGCLLFHGGRMMYGALKVFYPYTFPNDLPRYQYAYLRWIQSCKMSDFGWKFKIQHDTLQQAFSNGVILATPILLCAFNESEQISPLEVVGWVGWVCSFVMENKADLQKKAYVRNVMALVKTSTPERQAELKLACLGYGEFATDEYNMWTWCRHPNYFFEWMCWNSFVVGSIPSLLALESAPLQVLLGINLFLIPRFFYDCLNYWTGAEPAEHFSVAKRPSYRKYQNTTNVFFPHQLDFITSFFFDPKRNGFPPLPQDKDE